MIDREAQRAFAARTGGAAAVSGGRCRRRRQRILIALVAALSLVLPALARASFRAPVTLSPAGQNAYYPQVGVDSAGDATVVWRRSEGSHYRIQARTIAADRTLGATRTLSQAGQDANEPEVGVDSAGDATVVWRRHDGSDSRIQARTIAADGTLRATRTISPAGQSATSPQVGVNSAGDVTAVWDLFGGYTRVQASTGP